MGENRRGIIPARAGFTEVNFLRVNNITDHPRSRGVYVTGAELPENMTGSSPLARGLQQAARGHGAHRGIIPARAGFTA